MAVLNYATQYQRELAHAYPYVLYFGKLFTTSNNQLYKPVDAKTIKLPKITTSGRKDGDRDSVKAFGRNYDNDWEIKELTNHRFWDTLVHPQDVVQTNIVTTIGNITKTFNEFEKFPEKDRYLVSKLYTDWTALGKTADSTVLTTDNVLSIIDKYMETADEKRVPVNGRILYVTPAVNTLIKQAKELARYLSANESTINRKMTRIEELEVISVPSDIMKTVFDFTSGSAVGAGASQINMFMVHPTAVLTPETYSFAGLQEPSAVTQGKYYYYEEAFEDAFILDERADALFFNITA